MAYNLFLDDIRTPQITYDTCLRDIRYLKEEWIVVRNHDEFVATILSKGIPSLVSFDHDLADEHYAPPEFWGENYDEFSKSFREKTGFDCAKYLVKVCQDFEIKWFPEYLVHSANPVGKENILSYLRSYEKSKNKFPLG
jgi:hypothetical protein